jgi:hypothetical protein
MRSIKKWGRPLAFVAAFALMGMSQVGCGNECEDICNAAFDECTDSEILDCSEALEACLDAADICDILL